MSGRAGRRGLDSRGMVVLMMPEEVPQEALRSMMHGEALPLSSSFRLRFNTLLRLYGIESMRPEVLVAQSFYAFQRAAEVPRLQQQRHSLLGEVAALEPRSCDVERLQELLSVRTTRDTMVERAFQIAMQPKYALRFLQPGRLVLVAGEGGGESGGGESGESGGGGGGGERGWGVVVGFRHGSHASLTADVVGACSRHDIVLDVLLPCAAGSADLVATNGGTSAPRPAALSDPDAEAHVLPIRLSMVSRISAARLWLPSDLRPPRARRLGLAALRQLMATPARLGSARRAEAACLHPTRHLGVADDACTELLRNADSLEARERALVGELVDGSGVETRGMETPGADLERAPAWIEERLRDLRRRQQLEGAARKCEAEALQLATNEFGEQTARMQVVLRRLGHVDADNVVQLKGRAATEMEACDELLAAELLLDGTFNELSAAAAVALCACLVAEQSEKVKRPPPMHSDLAAPFAAVQAAARTLAAVLNDARIPTDEAEFVARFDGGLINVAYAWARGATFSELTTMCDLFEGSLIRALRRLSELLDELQSAAKAIGNEELYRKLDEGARLIRRDIVFAGSCVARDSTPCAPLAHVGLSLPTLSGCVQCSDADVGVRVRRVRACAHRNAHRLYIEG